MHNVSFCKHNNMLNILFCKYKNVQDEQRYIVDEQNGMQNKHCSAIFIKQKNYVQTMCSNMHIY